MMADNKIIKEFIDSELEHVSRYNLLQIFVEDLYPDYQKLSSNGKETLDKLSELVKRKGE